MSDASYYYDLCCKHKGKVVRIYDRYGREYVGRISHTDRDYVWLEPVHSGAGGFGFGFFFFPVALAAIGGFALGAAFFW